MNRGLSEAQGRRGHRARARPRHDRRPARRPGRRQGGAGRPPAGAGRRRETVALAAALGLVAVVGGVMYGIHTARGPDKQDRVAPNPNAPGPHRAGVRRRHALAQPVPRAGRPDRLRHGVPDGARAGHDRQPDHARPTATATATKPVPRPTAARTTAGAPPAAPRRPPRRRRLPHDDRPAGATTPPPDADDGPADDARPGRPPAPAATPATRGRRRHRRPRSGPTPGHDRRRLGRARPAAADRRRRPDGAGAPQPVRTRPGEVLPARDRDVRGWRVPTASTRRLSAPSPRARHRGRRRPAAVDVRGPPPAPPRPSPVPPTRSERPGCTRRSR